MKKVKKKAPGTPKTRPIKWKSQTLGIKHPQLCVSGAVTATDTQQRTQALEQTWGRLVDDLERLCRDDEWDFIAIGYRDDGGSLAFLPARFEKHGNLVPPKLSVTLDLRDLAKEYASLPDSELDEAGFEQAYGKLQAKVLKLVTQSLARRKTKARLAALRSRRPFAIYWWDGYGVLTRSTVQHLDGTAPARAPEPPPTNPLDQLIDNLERIDAPPRYALKIKKKRLLGVKLLFKRRAGIRVLQPLVDITDVETLDFCELPLTDQHLADILSNKPKLKVIDFLKLKAAEATVKAIVALPSLKTLELNKCTKLTPAALRALTRCKHVTDLTLGFHKDVDDRLIGSIAKMPNVQKLDVSGTPVTDKSIPRFIAMKKLKRLVTFRSGISAAGLKKLKQARPDLRLVTKL